METIKQINSKYLKQIKKSRQEIKYNRKKFRQKNKDNFLNNLKTLVSFYNFPEGWKVNVVASYFLLDKDTMSMPYDTDVWSFVDVVAATKNQGYDLVVFFNRSDLEFLSAPALIPIIVHELKHVEQATKDPKTYITTSVDDELNKTYEKEAEKEREFYSDEFRKQDVLEKVLYCYDKKSWKGANKMVHFLYEENENIYGGGYMKEMTKEEYEIYLKAEEEKDIDIFIDYFIDEDEIVKPAKPKPDKVEIKELVVIKKDKEENSKLKE
jgi:hypothetical protein